VKKAILLLIIFGGLLLCSCATVDTHNEVFCNPISNISAPDPYVKYIDGYYYALYTEATRITIFRNTSIDTVLQGESKVVFTIGKEVQGHVWAPELHYLPSTGRWYIYASGATDVLEFSTIRMFCLESVTSDPFGEYVFKDFTDDHTLAIDQTIFYDEKGQTMYTAFSEFANKGQVITLAVMENPWTVSDKRIQVSYPQYMWERMGITEDKDGRIIEGKDGRVNEGPIFLSHKDKLFLIYSASGCWSQYYCLGMLEYAGTDYAEKNVMNIENWVKSTEPIFSAANDVYGVGHCSFFASPDGKETWIAYHGMHTPYAGEAGRYMYVQKISFDKNGIPALGEPLARETEISLPSEGK